MAINAIEVRNLTKIYKLYDNRLDRLKEALNPFRASYHRDFYALQNVSFEVEKGVTLGIIGQNGSGKSTLLKIITGVLSPTKGNVKRIGRISALLELGAGFNPEFTGIENIYLFGTINGYTEKEVKEKIDDIIIFADIGEFIDQPVKTYSHGMFIRLAFAVSVNIEPDILIVDEALSVGDAYFQIKSINRMRQFKKEGNTIIFVSHDPEAIRTLCDMAILLDKGRIIDIGEPSNIIDIYNSMILKKAHIGDKKLQIKMAGDITSHKHEKDRVLKQHDDIHKNNHTFFRQTGTGEVELKSLKLFNQNGEEVVYIVSEDKLKMVFEIKAYKDIQEPHYGVILRNRFGNSAFETNTYCMGVKTKSLNKNDVAKITYEFDFNLYHGDYSISIGVSNKGYDNGTFEEYLLLIHDVEVIKVIENTKSIIYRGYYNMNPTVKIE